MRFAAILFGLVLSQIASGTQAQAGGAQTQNTACPYYVLLSNNIQTYIKVYSQSLLNELAAGKQLSDKPHTVSVKEILGPVYNYMASSAWPQGMTMAVSKLMSGPDEDIATCFPRLELVRINLQQYFDRKGQQGALVERYEKPLAETLREEHKAAEEGSASAQIHLGNMYFNGQGVPKDHQQAITLWRKAAEQGAAEAQYNLGYAYRHALGLPQDYQQALTWYSKSADQGWGQAQTELGFMYGTGLGVPQDYQQSFTWYRKAAEQGIAAAQHSLGIAYEHGRGVPRDGAQALQWYRKAAAQGYAYSIERLAAGPVPFPEGRSVPLPDETVCRRALNSERSGWVGGSAYADEASRRDLTIDACRQLAASSAPTFNTPASAAGGEKVQRQAQAEKEAREDANAAVNRGDYATALRIIRPLAEQGNAYAQLYLGMFFLEGWGVPRDYTEAVKWVRRAAHQGDDDAETMMGVMYRDGEGVPRDYTCAYMWFDLASHTSKPADAPGHYTPAERNLMLRGHVAGLMTDAQIAEARKLASDWKPGQLPQIGEATPSWARCQ